MLLAEARNGGRDKGKRSYTYLKSWGERVSRFWFPSLIFSFFPSFLLSSLNLVIVMLCVLVSYLLPIGFVARRLYISCVWPMLGHRKPAGWGVRSHNRNRWSTLPCAFTLKLR